MRPLAFQLRFWLFKKNGPNSPKYGKHRAIWKLLVWPPRKPLVCPHLGSKVDPKCGQTNGFQVLITFNLLLAAVRMRFWHNGGQTNNSRKGKRITLRHIYIYVCAWCEARFWTNFCHFESWVLDQIVFRCFKSQTAGVFVFWPQKLTKSKLGSGPIWPFFGPKIHDLIFTFVQNLTVTLVQNLTLKNGPFINICCLINLWSRYRNIVFGETQLKRSKIGKPKNTNFSHFWKQGLKITFVATPNLDKT